MLQAARFHKLLLLLGACCLWMGCGSQTIEPEIPLANKKIVILPFSDSHLRSYESPRGVELAQAVLSDIGAHVEQEDEGSLKLVPLREIEEQVVENAGRVDPMEIGKALEADYIVVGHIAKWEVGDAGSQVGFYRGRSQVEFEVWDLGQDGKVILRRSTQSRFPYGYFDTGVVSNTSEDGQVSVRDGLIQETAYMVGRHFYPYEYDRFNKR